MSEQEYEPDTTEERRNSSLDQRALFVICVIVAAGLLAILVFGLQATSFQSFASIAGFGIVMAGASLLAGGLIGFLFGIPRSLQREGSEPAKASAGSQGEDTRGRALYSANTNLEQISDWLTKILVGVGLTQISKIGDALGDIGNIATAGMGGFAAAKPFSIATTVYFTISGFLLGYLWTRLYLGRALTAAERTFSLKKKLDKFEQDARALRLAAQQLSGEEMTRPTKSELEEAIKAASTDTRSHIFYRAQYQRWRYWREEFTKPMMELTIPIFSALAESDVQKQYHRNYGQLGYALKDQRKPDWEAAEHALSLAIAIRDHAKDGEWDAYELNRAECRIARDQAFSHDEPTPTEAKLAIEADIKTATKDEWALGIVKSDPVITKWLKINKVALNDLARKAG